MFANRALSFDMACTRAYAELLGKSRAVGLAVSAPDAFITAVALANGFTVATRDTRPFEAAGLAVHPWEAAGWAQLLGSRRCRSRQRHRVRPGCCESCLRRAFHPLRPVRLRQQR